MAPSANVQAGSTLHMLQAWTLAGLSLMGAGFWDWQLPAGLAHSFLILSGGTWVTKLDALRALLYLIIMTSFLPAPTSSHVPALIMPVSTGTGPQVPVL